MDQNNKDFHPISYIAGETGVNPVTLRAWERRYGLIKPKRTPKGHRLYTLEDVMQVKQILFLLSKGHAISKVKPLLSKNVAELDEISVSSEFQHQFESIAYALAGLNHEHLANQLSELYTLYSPEQYAGIIHPNLMTYLNREIWPVCKNAICQKTFLYDCLLAKLYQYLYQNKHKNEKKTYIVIGFQTKNNQSMTLHGLFIANIMKAYEHRVDFISDLASEDELIMLAQANTSTDLIIYSDTELFYLNHLISRLNLTGLSNVFFSLPIVKKEALSHEAVMIPDEFSQIYGFLNRQPRGEECSAI
jgi:DNA-binding transcriptional MerR regulator